MLKKLNLKWGKKKSGEEERERERAKLTFFNLEFCTAKKRGHLAIRVTVKYTTFRF